MVLVLLPANAIALTSAEISQRIDVLESSLKDIASDLATAERELAEADAAIRQHTKAVAEAEARRAELREAISAHAAHLFKYGSTPDLELLQSDGLGSFIDRMAYLEQIRLGERTLLEEAVILGRRSKESAEKLSAVRDRATGVRARLMSRRSDLSTQLAELQRLQNFLGSTSGPVIGGRVDGGLVCPVVGPNVVANNFGDPRPGGPHMGNDIIADTGQYVRAVLPATVVDMPTGSWWGYGIVIRDLTGTEWAYAHMSSRSVHVGQRLQSGEVIGRVGCTGTCYGPHLHFEWWPGGGSPRDPYSLLSSAC